MSNFRLGLIQGLWRVRNREDGHTQEYRDWLRLVINVERRKRERDAWKP